MADELARLRAQWSQRLREAGFHDLEDWTGDPDGMLSHRGSPRLDTTDREAYARGTAAYYDQAGSFLHSHRFASAWERRTWELHCEGMSVVAISEATDTYRRKVDETLRRLRGIMLGEMLSEVRRKRGRPKVPGGRGRDSYLLALRLSDEETEALFRLSDQHDAPPRDVIRTILRFCVNTK